MIATEQDLRKIAEDNGHVLNSFMECRDARFAQCVNCRAFAFAHFERVFTINGFFTKPADVERNRLGKVVEKCAAIVVADKRRFSEVTTSTPTLFAIFNSPQNRRKARRR